VIVSHEHRFIFLRTEKTGSTSLTEALTQLVAHEGGVATLERPAWARWSPIHHGALKRSFPGTFGLHPHATARQARYVLGPKVFDGYFKFAVERNPWDRQVSLYFHRAWKRGDQSPDFDRDMRSIWYRNTEYTRLRNWDIYAIGGEVAVDRVLRYERLDAELAELATKLGLPPLALPRARSEYRSERPHYSTYYSDRTRALVAGWYRREIDALGYRFETPEMPEAAEVREGINAAAPAVARN
jgi:hypothetical protein